MITLRNYLESKFSVVFDGFPEQLEPGRVYRVTAGAGDRRGMEEVRFRLYPQNESLPTHVDYYWLTDDSTYHARLWENLREDALENYIYQTGTPLFDDEARNAEVRAGKARHNAEVHRILQEKGFE